MERATLAPPIYLERALLDQEARPHAPGHQAQGERTGGEPAFIAQPAEAGGGLFHVRFHALQDRLDGAYGERQADEHQGQHDPEGRESDAQAQGRDHAPDPAIGGEEGGQRDAGHGRFCCRPWRLF